MSREITGVTLTDNTPLVREALARATEQALIAVGQAAEKYAKKETPTGDHGGRLKNSMAHAVEGDSAYIGTNVEYAVYVEEGTGIYASNGDGRKGWWVYVVGSDNHQQSEKTFYTEQEAKQIAAILRSKGLDAHATNGSRPHHMLRKAATEHTDEYRELVKQAFSSAE